MSAFILLDLFCGAGGASKGYADAGFEVVGVDIKEQPNYPFKFWKADALVVLEIMVNGGGLQAGFYNQPWVAVHASPPCQVFSDAQVIRNRDHPDLLTPTREWLEKLGLPYVIENVRGAPMKNPQILEGQMFDLNTHRLRLFETNWGYHAPVLRPPPPRQAKMGRPLREGEAIQVIGNYSDVTAAREAMGIDWMTRDEMAQAIPPAYTQHIGDHLMAHLTQLKLPV